MENGLTVSAVLVLSMRLAVESFISMKRTGSGGRLRAASFPGGTGRKWEWRRPVVARAAVSSSTVWLMTAYPEATYSTARPTGAALQGRRRAKERLSQGYRPQTTARSTYHTAR
jgi:hypothetical protein